MTPHARLTLLRSLDEAALVAQIIAEAQRAGWLVHHDRPARRRDGAYRTHIAGDAGFPDLVLAKAGRVLFVEVKAQRWRWQPGQEAWLAATGGRRVGPDDLDALIAELWA